MGKSPGFSSCISILWYGSDRAARNEKGTDGTGHEMILAMASTRKTDGISYKTGFFLLFIKDEYA
jgi:hypothetical protein